MVMAVVASAAIPIAEPAWRSLAVLSPTPKPRALSPLTLSAHRGMHPSLLSSHLRSREPRAASRIQSDAEAMVCHCAATDRDRKPTLWLLPTAARVPRPVRNEAACVCVAVALWGALAITYSRDAMNP
jgi:hypothetical protein